MELVGFYMLWTVGPRKMHTIFGRKSEESGRKESKAATEKERSKSNLGIQLVFRK